MREFLIIMLFISLIAILMDDIELRGELKAKEKEIERLEWYEKQTKNYMLINLKQSEIINRYQSSRNDAQNDSELQQLILNLN